MLRVAGLETAYGRLKALHGVSLDVPAGSIVSLIGANGAGKTTLLLSIIGVLKPTAGQIIFEGQRIDGLPQKFLRAVSVIDGTAWIVGHEGLAATLPAGGAPTLVPVPDDRWLLGVYAAAADDVWIVGRSGLIMRGPPGVRGRDVSVP